MKQFAAVLLIASAEAFGIANILAKKNGTIGNNSPARVSRASVANVVQAAPVVHIDLGSDIRSHISSRQSDFESEIDSAFSSEIESEFKNVTLPGILGGRQRRIIAARFATRHYSEDDINEYLSDQSDRISDLNSLITDVGYVSDVDHVGAKGLIGGRRLPGGSFIDKISLGYRSHSDIQSDLASALDESQLLGHPRFLPGGQDRKFGGGIRILEKGQAAIVGGRHFLDSSDIESELESRYSERQSYFDSLVYSDLDG